jgi:hypothetical protein
LGELYANFGVASVLLLPAITLFLMYLSHWTFFASGNRPLVAAVVFLLVLWSVLASFEDSFITFVFVFVLVRCFRLERNLFVSEQLQTSFTS